jgi:hypothetical protein
MKPTKRRVSGWQNQKKKKNCIPAAGSPADGVSEGENWAARHATNDALPRWQPTICQVPT